MRYAKIDRRMFGDEKYRRLTAPEPCGQALWWHLLAGKQTGIIPGLYSIGQGAFAEQLGWSLKGFQEAFREVLREGMAKADWDAPLIWIPNAIRYNQPTAPNVVTSWRATWDELPECQLKVKAWEGLKAFLEGLSEAFPKAFVKACPKALANLYLYQEHDQEQELKLIPASPGDADAIAETNEPKTPKAKKPRTAPTGPHADAIRIFCSAWEERYGATYPFNGGKDGATIKKLLGHVGGDLDRFARIVGRYFAGSDKFATENRHTLPIFQSQFSKWLVEPEAIAPRVETVEEVRERERIRMESINSPDVPDRWRDWKPRSPDNGTH